VTAPESKGNPVPRFPVPEGLKLLALGEIRQKGDWIVHKDSNQMQYNFPVDATAGAPVEDYCGYWYFRPIPQEPAQAPMARKKLAEADAIFQALMLKAAENKPAAVPGVYLAYRIVRDRPAKVDNDIAEMLEQIARQG
jgi:hypothetical protein